MVRVLAVILRFAITIAVGFHAVPLEAHSGGLNSNGCHAGSQPYHCHRAPSDMVGNRLRCDLGSRSSECNNAPTGTASGSQEQSSDPYLELLEDLEDEETAAPKAEYAYLDCTNERPSPNVYYQYLRVTPDRSLASLNDFLEWSDRLTKVNLDYYVLSFQAARVNRSTLVLEFGEEDYLTGTVSWAASRKYQCALISAELMEEIRLKLLNDKKAKQRILSVIFDSSPSKGHPHVLFAKSVERHVP